MEQKMEYPEAIERIQKILCEIVDIDPAGLRDDLSFADDLFVDSLLAMEIIAAVETELQIEIDTETLLGIERVGDLYRTVAVFMN